MPTRTKDNYEIGYGKPPRHAGFKKGQSGNPRGRPPGAKNLTMLLNDALNEPSRSPRTAARTWSPHGRPPIRQGVRGGALTLQVRLPAGMCGARN